MRITQIDVADDAQLHAVFTAFDAGVRWGRDEAPIWHEHEFVGAFRTPDDSELQLVFLAEDDGRPAGMLGAYLPLDDNTDKLYVDLVVHPDHRRRGIGSALQAKLEEVAAEHGRTELLADANVPFADVETHPYRRFADKHGYRFSNMEVARHQPLPVPEAEIAAWEARAATKAAGYEIRTYVDEFPDELAESLCSLIGQLAVDAPTGEVVFEEEAMTPARLAQRQELSRAMGRSLFETVAVKDGVVAAQTTLSVPLEGPDVFQWGTFVHREHRGHSLGLAVKAANQRAMQAARPDAVRVRTQNAETNEWMIAINVMMGFEPFEACCDFVKRI